MKKRIADDVISRIPAPRFATYLAETDSGQGPNPYTALDLYLWNIEAAAAVTSTTSIVEVALRDCIDQQLRIWNQEKNRHQGLDYKASGSVIAHRQEHSTTLMAPYYQAAPV